MWEGIGLLLVYLVSGYLNKRKKDQQRREIESDPDWDNSVEETVGFDDLLTNLFKEKKNINIESESSRINDEIFETDNLTEQKDQLYEEKLDLTNPVNSKKDFEENIFHSKIADRKELHLGGKWNKRVNLKKELFKSPRMLKRAFILKAILDKPLGLKK
jgi:hypothetical protein